MILKSIIILLYIVIYSEAKFVAIFKDDVDDCENFVNKVVDFTKITVVQNTGDDTYITGEVPVMQEIKFGAQVKVKVFQEINGNKEYMYEIVGDICSQLDDEETPWYPVLNGMGITKCPIKKNVYVIDKVTIDISHFDDVMSSDYCGEYIAEIGFIQVPEDDPMSLGLKEISCHVFYASVLEVDD